LRRRRLRWLAAIAVAILIGAVASPFSLAALGRLLVDAGPPHKADLIVVLAGDWYGNRILKAGELVQQGYAPIALVSSPVHHYGVAEGELAIQYAAKHGFSPDLFDAVPIQGNSTEEEALELLAAARRRGARTLLVVTSDFHTRRARRFYPPGAGGFEIHMTAAPYPHFRADSWWKERESRKVWLLEFTKLVTSLVGM
jgi:uncharacterized SAM-binding protein YcdF (DUF218 family)